MDKTNELLNRNKVLGYFLIFATILSAVTLLSTGYTITKVLIVLSPVYLVNVLVLVLNWRKRFQVVTKYLIGGALVMATIFIVSTAQTPQSTYMIFLTTMLVLLYNDTKILLIIVTINTVLLIYFWNSYGQSIFNDTSVSAIVRALLVYGMFAGFAILQARYNKNLYVDLQTRQSETEEANNCVKNVLTGVANMTEEIDMFSNQIHAGIEKTNANSQVLVEKFEVMYNNILKQDYQLDDTKALIDSGKESLDTLLGNFVRSDEISTKTNDSVVDGSRDVNNLAGKIKIVFETISHTSTQMSSLENETESINKILNTIIGLQSKPIY